RGSTTTHANNSLLEYDSFLFEIEPDQGELTNVVIEEVDTFLVLEDSIPPGIESNFDPRGGVKIPFLTPASPLRAGGLSLGWNFHVL
ncbi:hypothetical protein Tco_0310323, partial [Tanacetum coccineum]